MIELTLAAKLTACVAVVALSYLGHRLGGMRP